MAAPFEQLFERIRARAEAYGIEVQSRPLRFDTPGMFDGLSITMNPGCDPEPASYYLVHAVGSIARWSQDPAGSRAVFDALRAARRNRHADPDGLERAIEGWRAFEENASEYAVWLLADLGYAAWVPSYTNFMRADAEAMVQFHRHGVAPVWHDFFAQWNQEVARGERQVTPYTARPLPPFRPVLMPTQEVIQEEDGKA